MRILSAPKFNAHAIIMWSRALPFVIVMSLSAQQASALKPEDVLGEYWKDPLFGEAAAQHTIEIEILHRKLWPEAMRVPTDKNVRFVVMNKTEELHMLAIASDPERLLEQEKFALRVQEDVLHASMEPIQDGQHTHAGTDVNNPEKLVKSLAQNPTVIVRPGEFKELLVQFEAPAVLNVFCVLNDHRNEGFTSRLRVVDASQPASSGQKNMSGIE